MESRMSRLQLSEDELDDGQEYIDMEADYRCEYREEIWEHLLVQEAAKPQIQLTSPQLEFRGALVKQLRATRRRLRLSSATLHAAVQLLDLFMDRHEVRADRLAHAALACLSLAAKSEEKFSRAPRLSALSKASGVVLATETFRQLEWMVGQHVRWRLLMPTAVTFASLMSHYVVTDDDLVSRNPTFVKRFRRDGLRRLESYLDLTLSDVRLKLMGAAEVGCACVACARASLGLPAWPARLAAAAGRSADQLACVARLLQGMMRIVSKSREESEEADQGYGSARTTPAASPGPPSPAAGPPSPAVETCVVRRDQLPSQKDYKAQLHIEETTGRRRPSAQNDDRYSYRPNAVEGGLDSDLTYYRERRLIEASLDILDAKGVKRPACRDVNGLAGKRCRIEAGNSGTLTSVADISRRSSGADSMASVPHSGERTARS